MTKEKRVHAMTLWMTILCGQRGGNRTSIVKHANDRRFWALVTCKRCLMYRKGANYG